MGKRILVVDDEQDIVKSVADMLTHNGYEVVQALDGNEALLKAREHPADLVILDLILPKLDGWRVCQTLKKDAHYRKVPFILLSALLHTDSTGGDETLDATDAYMAKPFQLDRLLAKVQAMLGEKSS